MVVAAAPPWEIVMPVDDRLLLLLLLPPPPIIAAAAPLCLTRTTTGAKSDHKGDNSGLGRQGTKVGVKEGWGACDVLLKKREWGAQ